MSVGKRDFSLVVLSKKIKTVIDKKKIERTVIDPSTALSVQYPKQNARRLMMLDLIEPLTQTGATCLMTEELTTSDIGMIEEHSVHGVIVLRPGDLGPAQLKRLKS
jgi:KaiC/GvpD/RAD55 family RecA-like ATPase